MMHIRYMPCSREINQLESGDSNHFLNLDRIYNPTKYHHNISKFGSNRIYIVKVSPLKFHQVKPPWYRG